MDDEVDGEGDSGGQDECSDQLHSYDELHGETEGTTKVSYEEKLCEIVHRRVNPSASLREEYRECVGYDCLADCLGTEYHFSFGEGLEHECRKVSIFSKQKQILLVQGIDDILGVVFDNVGISEDRNPIAAGAFRCFDPIHAEATRKTSDTTKHGLECLCEMMRDVVLEDYDVYCQ